MSTTGNWRHAETQNSLESVEDVVNQRTIALTIAYHPTLERIGHVCRLTGLSMGKPVSVSRLEPIFAAPGSAHGEALADTRISRSPIWLEPDGSGIRIDCRDTSTRVSINGIPVGAPTTVSRSELDRGAVIQLGKHFILILHRLPGLPARGTGYGLVGASEAMERLRSDIAKVCDIDVPVLLRGESGTGKELVARAIHDASPRAPRPYIPVNMAAITATTAASELFGHVRGAFTGAARDHEGYFSRAHGGTLLLDEIGETPPELQAMLLRALETREIQPVGAARTQQVDVRVVAATDADLERATQRGHFKAPLLHRLAGYSIHLPPLRERRDDIARLLIHFLRDEMRNLGEDARLQRNADAPFLHGDLMARLVSHDWPGNVRQLRNVVRQLAIASRGHQGLVDDRAALRLLDEPVVAPAAAPTSDGPTTPAELSEDKILSELRRNRFRLVATATALGISRTTLYAHIEKSERIRKAQDLESAEILEAISKCGGNLDRAAMMLEVSKRGLQLRMRALAIME